MRELGRSWIVCTCHLWCSTDGMPRDILLPYFTFKVGWWSAWDVFEFKEQFWTEFVREEPSWAAFYFPKWIKTHPCLLIDYRLWSSIWHLKVEHLRSSSILFLYAYYYPWTGTRGFQIQQLFIFLFKNQWHLANVPITEFDGYKIPFPFFKKSIWKEKWTEPDLRIINSWRRGKKPPTSWRGKGLL